VWLSKALSSLREQTQSAKRIATIDSKPPQAAHCAQALLQIGKAVKV